MTDVNVLSVFRELEDTGKLSGVGEDIFLKLLGNPNNAKTCTKHNEIYFVWRQDHMGERKYHSYHFLRFISGKWRLRTNTFFTTEEPVDIFDYDFNILPLNVKLILRKLTSRVNTIADSCIFSMASECSRLSVICVCDFLRRSDRFQNFLQGLVNRNIMDFGDKHDCNTFSIKFMLAPAHPCEMLMPDDWVEMKPVHVFQAVCKTCKKVFLACHAKVFEIFGPCHWDVDWNLAVHIAIRLYGMHRDYCLNAPELTKLEIPQHHMEKERFQEYQKANFTLRKLCNDENKIANYDARAVYRFSLLADVPSFQFNEILSLQ
jgi:hypothetical protein